MLRFRRRHWFWILPTLVVVLILAMDLYVASTAAPYLFENIEDTIEVPVAVVLGTSKYVQGGRVNLYYRTRIDAAVELYRAGKIKALIVSGDNSTEYYDEPSTMKTDLVALGVPEAIITCDYAGLRTLDSVVRAEKIFGQRYYLVVSQRFHCQRAVYIGRHYGQQIYGYCTPDVTGYRSYKVRLREVFARCKAVLDVLVLNTQPRFLGEPEPL